MSMRKRSRRHKSGRQGEKNLSCLPDASQLQVVRGLRSTAAGVHEEFAAGFSILAWFHGIITCARIIQLPATVFARHLHGGFLFFHILHSHESHLLPSKASPRTSKPRSGQAVLILKEGFKSAMHLLFKLRMKHRIARRRTEIRSTKYETMRH